jgi:hypothetical protein
VVGLTLFLREMAVGKPTNQAKNDEREHILFPS